MNWYWFDSDETGNWGNINDTLCNDDGNVSNFGDNNHNHSGNVVPGNVNIVVFVVMLKPLKEQCSFRWYY